MRKLGIIFAVTLLALVSRADYVWIPMTVKCGTASTGSVTTVVKGDVLEVWVANPTVASTNVIGLTVSPAIQTGLSEVTLYTNATLSAKAVSRPRYLSQDNTGADLSTLTIREPYRSGGDTVRLWVAEANGVTNVQIKIYLKVDTR